MAAPKGNKNAEGHGRPTDYKPEYDQQAYRLCLLGLTDAELATFFGVSETTINNWKTSNDSFFESIKKGKLLADGSVADSLYQRANGYEHPDTDIRVVDGQIVETPIVKYYPPDTAAAIFWLKNRQKHMWRDKVDHDLTTNGKDIQPVTVFELPSNGRDTTDKQS